MHQRAPGLPDPARGGHADDGRRDDGAHGDTAASAVVEPHLRTVEAPVDLLRDLHIVDTPGTNAILRQHEAITSAFVPRSDLVLFVTSADRPFTETERAFLERIRDWGKKVVVVINKIDILERPEDVDRGRTVRGPEQPGAPGAHAGGLPGVRAPGAARP